MKEVIKMGFISKNKTKQGQNIKELRLTLGETQKQFATRLNVAKETVGQWERGRCSPSANKMGKMTQLYKQTFSDISSFEKLQKPTNSEKIDKSKILELLVRELNPLEQYSSKELLEELTRRASKKDDL